VNIRTRAVTGTRGAPPSYGHAFPQPLCAAALRIGAATGIQGTLDLQRAVATITPAKGDKTEVRVLADRNVLLISSKEAVGIEPVHGGLTGKTDGVEWLHVTLPGDIDYKGMEYCVAVAGTAGTKVAALVTSFDLTTGDVRGAAIALAKNDSTESVAQASVRSGLRLPGSENRSDAARSGAVLPFVHETVQQGRCREDPARAVV
jgi:hypothetical protein